MAHITPELEQKLLELCKQGNKLAAVKEVKDATGMGLKESKDYIDQLCTRHGLPNPGSGCFVATACYGHYDAPEVMVLRRFRDEQLMTRRVGRAVVQCYYTLSPPLARQLEKSEKGKSWVRKNILAPIVRRIHNHNR